MSALTIIGLTVVFMGAFTSGLFAGWWLAMRRIDLQLDEMERERETQTH